MVDEGQITIEEPSESAGRGAPGSGPARQQGEVRGHRQVARLPGLQDAEGPAGLARQISFGRHDTRDLATGIEANGSSKQYEFGDTLNLDVSETLFSAIRREGAKVPLNWSTRTCTSTSASTRAPARRC